MPELKEVFDMVTKQAEPEVDSWREQEQRQRRHARNRRAGAIAVAAAIVIALVLAVLALPKDQRQRTAGDPTDSQEFLPEGPIGAQIVELDGTVILQLPAQVILGEQPQLSPDGSTIAYYRNDAVWTIGWDGTGERRLTPPSNDVVGAKNAVSWSPTGDELAYAFNGEIYAMNADGSKKRRLTNSPNGMGSYAPTWAPDGIAIAFWRGTSATDNEAPDDSEIFVVGAGGGRAFQLTHDDDASFQPAFSADGSRIAYRRHNPDDIVVMNADGTDAHTVTEDELNPWSPSWSSDGSRLAFLRCCADHESVAGRPLLEVVVLDLATGETQPLGMYVETENNVPQWVSSSRLLINRQE